MAFSSQPESKKKTGLVIGAIAAVIVLVVLAITAFAAPGFLVSDDESTADSSTGEPAPSGLDGLPSEAIPPEPSGTAPPVPNTDGDTEANGKAFAQYVLTAIEAGNTSLVVYCAGESAKVSVEFAASRKAKLVPSNPLYNRAFYNVDLNGTIGNEPLDHGKLAVIFEPDRWCVRTLIAI